MPETFDDTTIEFKLEKTIDMIEKVVEIIDGLERRIGHLERWNTLNSNAIDDLCKR